MYDEISAYSLSTKKKVSCFVMQNNSLSYFMPWEWSFDYM